MGARNAHNKYYDPVSGDWEAGQAGDPPAKCRCEQMTPSKLAANPRNFYYFDSKHAHKSQHTGWKTTGYFGKWGYLFNSVRQFLFVLRKTF